MVETEASASLRTADLGEARAFLNPRFSSSDVAPVPEKPYTLASPAGIAGLSPRAVQLGFRRHLGTTPMGFVRDIRLSRAHEELGSAEPSSVTVASVAHRWGFVHLGRFAQLYRERYGVSPSQAIRR